MTMSPRFSSEAKTQTSLSNAWEVDARCLHIGLVNNMPDAALEATERQFRTLLDEAADGIAVRLSFFALPEVPRSERAGRRIAGSYLPVSELWESRLDGLIVTGAEPVAANLQDEPYWPSLARLIDWAEYNTYSSIWSCLAAHAAVLHIDGIGRRRLTDKLFGVFECANVAEHPLTAGIPNRFRLPHSRWNDLPGDALAACGYRILTRFNDGRVDTFVKQRKNLFVFFQGHPEYEAASLLLEYRRDFRRFLNRERDAYPAMPQGYFDDETAARFSGLHTRTTKVCGGPSACGGSSACAGLPIPLYRPSLTSSGLQKECPQNPCPDFPADVRAINTWRPEAVRFYRNWLHYLSGQKSRDPQTRQTPMPYQIPGAGTSAPELLAPKADAE